MVSQMAVRGKVLISIQFHSTASGAWVLKTYDVKDFGGYPNLQIICVT